MYRWLDLRLGRAFFLWAVMITTIACHGYWGAYHNQEAPDYPNPERMNHYAAIHLTYRLP